MTFSLDELQLDESYEFNVLVQDNNTTFAGKLILSPAECSITIMGEATDQRSLSLQFHDTEEIICSDLNKTFVLRDLTPKHFQKSVLFRRPEYASYFECTFNIGLVLFIATGTWPKQASISLISLQSETIDRWVGDTDLQEEILQNHGDQLSNTNLDEFVIDTGGGVVIGVSYKFFKYMSLTQFKSGMAFPPCLIARFSEPLNARSVGPAYEKIYNLFSFVSGNSSAPKKVRFSLHSHRSQGSIYFPSTASSTNTCSDLMLFPLTRNLRLDQLGLPIFPLDCLSNYYGFADDELDVWRRYLKYRKMSSSEERFLGYFRLLERLCFKRKPYLDEEKLASLLSRSKKFLIKYFGNKSDVDSFLRGMSRYNGSKYNTSKCIKDFYKEIPVECTGKWNTGRGDIDAVCDMRNNIAHAI